MTLPTSPWRHWRSYGTEPLPTPTEALDEPLRAFPSWFLKITCDRCGKDRFLNEAHAGRQRDMPLRVLIARMRPDGYGGRPGRAELLTVSTASAAGRCGGSCCGLGNPQRGEESAVTKDLSEKLRRQMAADRRRAATLDWGLVEVALDRVLEKYREVDPSDVDLMAAARKRFHVAIGRPQGMLAARDVVRHATNARRAISAMRAALDDEADAKERKTAADTRQVRRTLTGPRTRR